MVENTKRRCQGISRPPQWIDGVVPPGDPDLVPGMPIDTFIKTTDRTVLSYLVNPLSAYINQAVREE
jgi:multidrug efflux pump subunit AcrA (membrane-fusion protein)